MNYYCLTPCTAPRRFELTDMNASSTQTQAISRNGSVSIMLETVVRTTGMRFAAIARVTTPLGPDAQCVTRLIS